MVEQFVEGLRFTDILDLVFMSDTLGKDIHLVSSTVRISGVIGDQPSNASVKVNLPCSWCVYKQGFGHIRVRLRIQYNDIAKVVIKKGCHVYMGICCISLNQLDDIRAMIPAIVVSTNDVSSGSEMLPCSSSVFFASNCGSTTLMEHLSKYSGSFGFKKGYQPYFIRSMYFVFLVVFVVVPFDRSRLSYWLLLCWWFYCI